MAARIVKKSQQLDGHARRFHYFNVNCGSEILSVLNCVMNREIAKRCVAIDESDISVDY